MALRNILGGFPTYMRPPYSSCSAASGCLGEMGDLGYHVTYFNLDTDDYNNDAPDMIQRSKDIFDSYVTLGALEGRPLLEIGHDVHEQTVYNLTSYMLRRLENTDYRVVTLGECLGDPSANWYRWTTRPDEQRPGRDSPGSGKKIKPVKPLSPDGTCGTSYTCTGSSFGRCCSAAGFCGNRAIHCGKGCQKIGGICSGNPLDSDKGHKKEVNETGKVNKEDASHTADHFDINQTGQKVEEGEDRMLGNTEDKKLNNEDGNKAGDEQTAENDEDRKIDAKENAGNENHHEEDV
ncbi:hypothetical protein FQN49_006336 [Arthroderma sp. PD_2]|nr:hypothetical protein FQN49_006336 [Arthroderma sp. PD_2]